MFLTKYVFSCARRAAASLNTPLFEINASTMQKIQDLGIFDYQVYFQQPVSTKRKDINENGPLTISDV